MKNNKRIKERLKLEIPKNFLSKKEKHEIEKSVKKTVKEYGETLRLLGRE